MNISDKIKGALNNDIPNEIASLLDYTANPNDIVEILKKDSKAEVLKVYKDGVEFEDAVSTNTSGDNDTINKDNITNEISFILNGKKLDFSQSPVIENGTTLVPMRAIFEAMGATIEWNNDTKTVVSKKDDVTISLTLNKNIATVNDKEISLVVPAKLVNGNTMVPLRFVSESMGAEVKWNGERKTVTINSK